MKVEFDPHKDAVNQEKHGVGLAYGKAVFDDPDRLVIDTSREADSEERLKAVGKVDGKLWTAVFAYRGTVMRMISVRRSNVRERREYDSDSG